MNTEDRLKYCAAMIIIPTVFLILFGSLNYVHRVKNEVKNLKTEVKTKNNLIECSKIENKNLQTDLKKERLEKRKIEEEFRNYKENRSKEESLEVWKITSYCLDYSDCNKNPGDYWYGITFSGFDLRNKTREQTMCIAVDRNFIPLKSKVKISFIKEKYKYLNGTYVAYDIGEGVIGKHLDIFFGDSKKSTQAVKEFGIQYAKVEIIK